MTEYGGPEVLRLVDLARAGVRDRDRSGSECTRRR